MPAIGSDQLRGPFDSVISFRPGIVENMDMPISKAKLPDAGSAVNAQNSVLSMQLPPGGVIGAQLPQWLLPVALLGAGLLILSSMKPNRR